MLKHDEKAVGAMIFSMMLNNKSEHERAMIRRFIRHVLVGFAAGFILGAVGYVLILLALAGTAIEIPILFAFAMLYQMGALGGLVGLGVYMSRIAERGNSGGGDEDGGSKAASEEASPVPPHPAPARPAPVKPGMTPKPGLARTQ